MNTAGKRFVSSTPPFFKKMQWIFGIIMTIMIAALPVLNTMPEVPAVILKIVELCIAICGAIVATAQFTTTDKTLTKEN